MEGSVAAATASALQKLTSTNSNDLHLCNGSMSRSWMQLATFSLKSLLQELKGPMAVRLLQCARLRSHNSCKCCNGEMSLRRPQWLRSHFCSLVHFLIGAMSATSDQLMSRVRRFGH